MGKVKDVFTSFATGKILLKLGLDKLFPFILYAFFLTVVSMWLSYKAEITMQKVEDNKKKIENLKIENLEKTCKIISLTKISTIEKMLDEHGSEVKAPQKPAYRIK